MKILAFAALSVALLGARHETPIHAYERPVHDRSCDYAVEHQSAQIAADRCLQAADEWAGLAAKNSGTVEGRYDEFVGMVARLLTAQAMEKARVGYAFDQMALAVSIANSICPAYKLLDFEIAACSAVAETAAADYPKVWAIKTEKEAP